MTRAKSEHRAPSGPAQDVLVVGAGPAGAALAALLARRGWQVTVIDRATFPRPKACGEFVSPGALRALDRMGLAVSAVESRAATVGGWALDIDGFELSAAFPPGEQGISLPRSILDAHLVSQARQAGATVLESTRLMKGSLSSILVGRGSESRSMSPRALVGAGGLRCPVAARLGALGSGPRPRKVSLTGRVRDVGLAPDRGHLIVRGDLTLGAAPSTPDACSWNVTVVVPSHRYGRRIATIGPGSFYRACLARAGLGEGRPDSGEPLLASGPFDRPTRRIYGGNAVVVGDAAGYFDPFTGQGIYQALRSAEVLAGCLHQGLAGSVSLAEAFESYARVIQRERRGTKRVQWWIDRTLASPSGRRLATAVLARYPSIYDTILEITTDRRGFAAAVAGHVRDHMTARYDQGRESPSLSSRTA